jgi:hypothetical protein
VTRALWPSNAAGGSTIVSTTPLRSTPAPPSRDLQDRPIWQACSQHRGPGRSHAPNSKQAQRHQGKKIGVVDGPADHPPFHAPARIRDSGQINSNRQRRSAQSPRVTCSRRSFRAAAVPGGSKTWCLASVSALGRLNPTERCRWRVALAPVG